MNGLLGPLVISALMAGASAYPGSSVSGSAAAGDRRYNFLNKKAALHPSTGS